MSGAYAWGSLGDAKGRKLGFFATALFTFTFGVLSAVAPSYGASLPTSMQSLKHYRTQGFLAASVITEHSTQMQSI